MAQQKQRIVILEHDWDFRVKLVQRLIAANSHITHQPAATLSDAMRLLANGPTDLLIVDVNGPDLDSVRGVQLIRASQPEMPIIALVTAGQQTLKQRLLDAGVPYVLDMPFQPGQLIRWVNEALHSPRIYVGIIPTGNELAARLHACLSNGETLAVAVEGHGQFAEIAIVEGRLASVNVGDLGGDAAMSRVLRWRDCRLFARPILDAPSGPPQVLSSDWPERLGRGGFSSSPGGSGFPIPIEDDEEDVPVAAAVAPPPQPPQRSAPPARPAAPPTAAPPPRAAAPPAPPPMPVAPPSAPPPTPVAPPVQAPPVRAGSSPRAPAIPAGQKPPAAPATSTAPASRLTPAGQVASSAVGVLDLDERDLVRPALPVAEPVASGPTVGYPQPTAASPVRPAIAAPPPAAPPPAAPPPVAPRSSPPTMPPAVPPSRQPSPVMLSGEMSAVSPAFGSDVALSGEVPAVTMPGASSQSVVAEVVAPGPLTRSRNTLASMTSIMPALPAEPEADARPSEPEGLDVSFEMPAPRFDAEGGLHDEPTVANSDTTFAANVAAALLNLPLPPGSSSLGKMVGRKIGKILFRMNRISEDQLRQAVRAQRAWREQRREPDRPIGSFLLEAKIVTPDDLRLALAVQKSVPLEEIPLEQVVQPVGWTFPLPAQPPPTPPSAAGRPPAPVSLSSEGSAVVAATTAQVAPAAFAVARAAPAAVPAPPQPAAPAAPAARAGLPSLFSEPRETDPVLANLSVVAEVVGELSGTGPLVRPKRVLVVEPDTSFRTEITQRLRRRYQGAEFQEAADATTAARMLNQLEPDLMLLDPAAPGLAGAETVRQWKKVHSGLTVIILRRPGTSEQTRLELFEAGAAYCLDAPFRSAVLHTAVTEALSTPRAFVRRLATGDLAVRLLEWAESATNAVLVVDSLQEQIGEVFLSAGRVLDAVISSSTSHPMTVLQRGDDALRQMLEWKSGLLFVRTLEVLPPARCNPNWAKWLAATPTRPQPTPVGAASAEPAATPPPASILSSVMSAMSGPEVAQVRVNPQDVSAGGSMIGVKFVDDELTPPRAETRVEPRAETRAEPRAETRAEPPRAETRAEPPRESRSVVEEFARELTGQTHTGELHAEIVRSGLTDEPTRIEGPETAEPTGGPNDTAMPVVTDFEEPFDLGPSPRLAAPLPADGSAVPTITPAPPGDFADLPDLSDMTTQDMGMLTVARPPEAVVPARPEPPSTPTAAVAAAAPAAVTSAATPASATGQSGVFVPVSTSVARGKPTVNRQKLETICRGLVEAVDAGLAAGVMELSSARMLAQHLAPAVPGELSALLAAGVSELFIGGTAQRFEEVLARRFGGAANGKETDPPVEEALLCGRGVRVFVRRFAGRDAAMALAARSSLDPAAGWIRLSDAMKSAGAELV